MLGQMMDAPLLISELIEFAARNHRGGEIVSRTVEGPIVRHTYGEVHARILRLAKALGSLGIGFGDRVATLAWNTHRHFELYFAISGLGAVCHTVNPRLFEQQLEYVFNHAEDRVVFVDLTFVPILEKLAERLPKVEAYVVLTDAAHMPATSLPNCHCYEDLLAAESPEFVWPTFDEKTAASLCYTSGTTGNPKGVLYSHRSTLLHTFMINAAENLAISSRTTILPAVPMFHVNAWGIPYGCAMAGAKLVLPGPGYDGASMWELMRSERVTVAAGVPTIWMTLLDHVRAEGGDLEHLEVAMIGGAAAPLSMVEAFEQEFGVQVYHAWGMTETSPVASCGRLAPSKLERTEHEQRVLKTTQGHGVFGVRWKIIDETGRELPWDGCARGELCVFGPTVVGHYYNDEEASAEAFDADGWFRTGDVATIDRDGYMHIVDRSKDLIKSGGEWISSIDLENAALGHPDVQEAAVIGIAHAEWGERPLLVIVPVDAAAPAKESLLDFLRERVAKWWLPDDVVFVEALPHTATGKISKRLLRDEFRDYRFA